MTGITCSFYPGCPEWVFGLSSPTVTSELLFNALKLLYHKFTPDGNTMFGCEAGRELKDILHRLGGVEGFWIGVGRQVCINSNNRPARVDIHNVEREEHVLHPKSHVVWGVKDK